MQEKRCRHCGSSAIKVKEIEIRHINSHNMSVASKQKVTELECMSCGLVISLDKASAACSR
jgi:ribosomal protein L40E